MSGDETLSTKSNQITPMLGAFVKAVNSQLQLQKSATDTAMARAVSAEAKASELQEANRAHRLRIAVLSAHEV